MSASSSDEKKEQIINDKTKVVVDDDSSATDIDEGEKIYDGMTPRTYRWVINDYPTMAKANNEKERSDEFDIGDCRWKMLLFPNGNGVEKNQNLSLYLEVSDRDELPKGWRRDARMWLHVVNQKDETKSVRNETARVFSSQCVDWGFPRLITLERLNDPEEGFLSADGQLILEVEIIVFRTWVDYHALRDYRINTRAQTGYVGLYNQGATCYLNAWLQSLFHIGAFRRAVYQMNTKDEDVRKSIPLALQRLFYRLQFSDDSTTTQELTRAFGWSRADTHTQHDVHELNCLLLDSLERKMKGSAAEGAIERLFRGEIVNYIDCVNVDYKSERKEHIYDIGLVVKGCNNIYESFEKYVEPELMTGDNQYRAEGHGLQDARKGVRFSKLPPVLLLQLQRWTLDLQRFVTYKVNDKYAFHPVLDLSKYLPKDSKDSGIYHLHGILVHTGGAGGGHYYAYTRPTSAPDWFLFDDSRITKADEKEAIEDNWGGFEKRTFKRFGKVFDWTRELCSNAYMLVYVRETDVHELINDEGTDAISTHVQAVGEEHLFTKIRVATAKDFRENHNMVLPDLIRPNEVEPLRIKKTHTLLDLQKLAETKLHIPFQYQRLWLFTVRDNHTMRIGFSVDPSELSKVSVEKLQSNRAFVNSKKVLWLEDIRETACAQAIPGVRSPFALDSTSNDGESSTTTTTSTNDDVSLEQLQDAAKLSKQHIIVFLKEFDPVKQNMRYIGQGSFHTQSTVQAFEKALCAFVPEYEFGRDQFMIWEEVYHRRFDPMNPGDTLVDADLVNGDIVVLMKQREPDVIAECKTKTPKEWCNYIRFRVDVEFRALDTPDDESKHFTLELSKRMSYVEVAQAVGAHLNFDPSKLRFTGHTPNNSGPRFEPCPTNYSLKEMLTTYMGGHTTILYYEQLSVTLNELASMRQVKVFFQNAKTEKAARPLAIHVPQECKISQVFVELEKVLDKDQLTYNTHKYRLIEVYSCKVFRSYDADASSESLSLYSPYIVEECHPDELDPQDGDKLINVTHYELSTIGNAFPFGNPFQILAKSGETLASLKQRIREKLEVDESEFKQWKFALASYGSHKYLEDDTKVAELEFDEFGYLGIEHEQPITPVSSGHHATQMHQPGLRLRQSGNDPKPTN